MYNVQPRSNKVKSDCSEQAMGSGKGGGGTLDTNGRNQQQQGEVTAGGKSHRGKGGRSTGRQRLSDDPTELASKQECLKSMKEFNKETARYCCLVLALGSNVDSDVLRDELKKCWKKAHDLAKQNKSKLLPHLKGRLCKIEEVEEYEKLWTTFGSCLESLQGQMWRTLSLLRVFPLHQGEQPILFVRTGQIEAILGQKASGHCAVAVEPLDGSSQGEAGNAEREEARGLERDICDISDMLQEIQEIVDVKPWTIEPEVDTAKIMERSKSLHSGGSGVSSEEMISVFNSQQHKKRKCICLMLLILLAVVILGTVLAVCIAMLT